MRRSLLFAAACTVACDSAPPVETRDTAAVAPVSVASPSPFLDSTRIVVNGPTLIAFYPAIPVSDTSEETATVMDDFSHHLSTASDSLEAMGFRIEMRVVDSVHITQDKRRVDFRPPKDSADVGYYFAGPGQSPWIVHGVRTNADLIRMGREFLSANP